MQYESTNMQKWSKNSDDKGESQSRQNNTPPV